MWKLEIVSHLPDYDANVGSKCLVNKIRPSTFEVALLHYFRDLKSNNCLGFARLIESITTLQEGGALGNPIKVSKISNTQQGLLSPRDVAKLMDTRMRFTSLTRNMVIYYFILLAKCKTNDKKHQTMLIFIFLLPYSVFPMALFFLQIG